MAPTCLLSLQVWIAVIDLTVKVWERGRLEELIRKQIPAEQRPELW